MKFNIFAGARRAAVVAAVAIVVATAVAVFTEQTTVMHTYSRLPPGSSLRVTRLQWCPSVLEYAATVLITPGGVEFTARVCSSSHERSASGFGTIVAKLTSEDYSYVERETSERTWYERRNYLIIGGAALTTLLVGTWVIGWVIRGFLGIPRGWTGGQSLRLRQEGDGPNGSIMTTAPHFGARPAWTSKMIMPQARERYHVTSIDQ
jgi:hypothetical protein